MKFVEMLISFLTQQGMSAFHTNTESAAKHAALYVRRSLILITIIAIGIVLFCSGFTMAYRGVVDSLLPETTSWRLAPIVGGSALALVALGLLAYAFAERRWVEAVHVAKESEPKAASSPIENAIAVLLLEAANELRARRDRAAPPPSSST